MLSNGMQCSCSGSPASLFGVFAGVIRFYLFFIVCFYCVCFMFLFVFWLFSLFFCMFYVLFCVCACFYVFYLFSLFFLEGSPGDPRGGVAKNPYKNLSKWTFRRSECSSHDGWYTVAIFMFICLYLCFL